MVRAVWKRSTVGAPVVLVDKFSKHTPCPFAQGVWLELGQIMESGDARDARDA